MRSTTTSLEFGFWIERYSAKADSVEPSAKYQLVAGAGAPTLSVEPSQVPLLKCITRSTTPGTDRMTRAETWWLAPTSAFTSSSRTCPAVSDRTTVGWCPCSV